MRGPGTRLNQAEHLGRQHYAILALSWAGWLFDFYDLILYSFLLVPIAAEFGFSPEESSLVLGISLGCTALGGVIFGRLADRFGRKSVLQWTILAYSVGALLSGLASGLWTLGAARVVTAVGVGGECRRGNRGRGGGSAGLRGMRAAAIAPFSIRRHWPNAECRHPAVRGRCSPWRRREAAAPAGADQHMHWFGMNDQAYSRTAGDDDALQATTTDRPVARIVAADPAFRFARDHVVKRVPCGMDAGSAGRPRRPRPPSGRSGPTSLTPTP